MTVTVAVALADPLVAVIVAVPAATEVTRPVLDTVAAPPVAAHVTVALAIVAPFWSLTVADSWDVAPSDARLRLVAERVIEVATGVGVGVGVGVPELGPVVLSPPHAVNSKATPTNSLYRCITSSQSHKIVRVYGHEVAQPMLEISVYAAHISKCSRKNATVRGQACSVALMLAPSRSGCARRKPWPAASYTSTS